ncbi:uncharacterized protein BDV14DRAFT_210891 [Aspergillus stella-maris]|uniref:uncharacterized protein n=1 Tax=Aspergillus stella-maris TaxID=1810926 RepID=UPI003CCD8D52
MRHFDAWILRDPYSIFHYYSTGHRWKETVRDLIQERKICAPLSLSLDNLNDESSSLTFAPIDPYALPINNQEQSRLLSKLPLEIRLLIYEYVFGQEVVHLVQVKDKIRHVRCHSTSSSLDKNRRCCPLALARWRADAASSSDESIAVNAGSNMLYPHTHPSLPSHLSNSSTSLLRTCRTIYAESSLALYKNSTFDVDDLTTFIAFSLSISPAALHSIKKLTIQWTPVWQPLAGEEHKSSIFSHTHNDRLWALFWERVGRCQGLELGLSVDLGSFAAQPQVPAAAAAGAGNVNNTPGPQIQAQAQGQPQAPGQGRGLIGGTRLTLNISSPWVAPLLSLRGLKGFELGITVKCDAVAKEVLEGGLVRDAVTLRDHLRTVMCSPRGAALPSLSLPGVKVRDLGLQVELLRRCAVETEGVGERRGVRGVRPRLAITAA